VTRAVPVPPGAVEVPSELSLHGEVDTHDEASQLDREHYHGRYLHLLNQRPEGDPLFATHTPHLSLLGGPGWASRKREGDERAR
jgi:hypothetical protein